MTKEQIKAKAKEQFPNDEFKQQIVLDAINWTTKELEKENAELKKAYRKQRNKRIDELQKENAELKDKNKALEQYADLADAKVDEVKGSLTKAKEIIHRLLVALKDHKWWNYHVIDEAMQFLKEIDK